VAQRGIPPSIRFVWEQAEHRPDAQMKQADSLDTKAGAMVGFHALAVGILAAALASIQGNARWLVVATILGLIVSGSFAFFAFRTESYDRSPAPEELWQFADWTEEEIIIRFPSTRFRALEKNRDRLEVKARYFARSLSTLGAIVLSLSISAVVDLAAR
jgi:hypothetical protein